MVEEIGIDEPIPESILEGRRKRSRTQRSAQFGDDVFDGVAYRAEIFEILVFDSEADGPFRELFFDCFDKFNEGERVSIQVVSERVAFINARRLNLKDLRETIPHQGDNLIAADRSLFDMGFSRHGFPLVVAT